MRDGARRVHPASLIMATALAARNVAAGGIGVVVLAWRGEWGWAAAVLAIGLAVLSVLPWLRWWRFTYRIGDGELVIDEGLLNRRRRSVPFERIQDIAIEQGLFARLFGIVTVKIETAGGKADDVALSGVKRSEAARLRAILLPGRLPEGLKGSATPPVFAMGIARVVLNGLLSFSLLLWIVAVGDVVRRIGNLFDYKLGDLIGIAEHDVAPRLSLAVIGGGLALIVLIGVGAGVVRAVLRDYGFRLTHGEGRFRCTRGLVPRRETVIVDRRIQLALVRQNLLGRVFGWYGVDFQTLGGSDGPSGRQEAAPLARADEAARVIAVAGLPAFAEARLVAVDPGHGTRVAIRLCLWLGAVVAVAAWFEPWALALLVLGVPLVLLARTAPRLHRLVLEEGTLHVAQGLVGRRSWIVPVAAVQSVTLRRGPIQRMLGLVSVEPDTAGANGHHRPVVADLALAGGVALAAGLVRRG